MFGRPERDPHAIAAMREWLSYYVDCETFDRTVCTGGFDEDGDVMPETGEQRAKINAHARRRSEQAQRTLAAIGVDGEVSFSARRYACGLRFDDAERELATMAGLPIK